VLALLEGRRGCPRPLPADPFGLFRQQATATERWVRARISNFEYLLILNRLSGRDFQDLEQYPLFPWLHEGRVLSQAFDKRTTCVNIPMNSAMAAQFLTPPFARDVAAIAAECARTGVEAVPELFAVPEFTSLEHCYGLRKVLEGPGASAELHNWIYLIWSSDCKSGIDPLFSGVHPRRVGAVSGLTAVVAVALPEKVEQAVLIVSASAFVMRYRTAIALTDLEFSLKKPTRSPLQLRTREIHGRLPNEAVFTNFKGRIVAFEGENVYKIDSNSGHVGRITIEPLAADITCIAAAGKCFLIGCEDSALWFYRNGSVFWQTFAYRSAVKCCAIGAYSKVVVAGLADGSVIVSSLANGDIVHVLSVSPATPEKVLVTHAWGFIVVYAIDAGRYWLFVWTLNGKLVKQLEVRFPVGAWGCWRSTQAFDFIGLASPDGDVHVAEVCYIESLECVFRTGDAIVTIDYVDDLDGIVVVTRSSKVFILPFRPTL
jgi:hypothetical protein